MREEGVLFVGRVTGHSRVSLEKMCVYFRVLMNLHFHLEGVELLFDLLSQHWSQSIARSNLTSSIVFPTRPGIVELDTRTECSIALLEP